jgi:hypothetical protein
MKPADHPDFFRLPPPPGRSRESTIRLDAEGHFWHDGRRVEHAGLEAGLHAWIGRHPDDGRYILNNGYDWSYFAVDDVPYVVRALRVAPESVTLVLDDGSEEVWQPGETRVGPGDALYTVVKRSTPGGPFEARFSRHAQGALEPLLVPGDEEEQPAVRIGGRMHSIGAKRGPFG